MFTKSDVADVKDKAVEAAVEGIGAARENVAPVVSAAIEKSGPVRAEAAVRATNAISALKGETPAPTKARWPLAVLALGLGLVAGAIGSRLTGTGPSTGI